MKATFELRWIIKTDYRGSDGNSWGRIRKVLEQKFIDENGLEKWVEVPTVNE